MQDDSEMVVDAHEVEMMADEPEGGDPDEGDFSEIPNFPQVSALDARGRVVETRRVPIPAHRLTPLKQSWMAIYQPLVEHMLLQVRFNPKRRSVDIRVSPPHIAHPSDLFYLMTTLPSPPSIVLKHMFI